MACSCSHWWHAPIYLSMSLVLALFAISSPPPPTTTTTSSTAFLFLNQSTTISPAAIPALRSHGFALTAAFLQLSPELFLSTTPSTITIFAIPDDVVSNLSAPSWALKLLFQFHILPFKLTLQNLLVKPQNSCLPTSLSSKHLALTRTIPHDSSIEINNVRISHPDLFLDDSVSIHGVLAPFTPLDPDKIRSGLDFIQSPPCDFLNSTLRPDLWVRVIRVLSSNGFVSFAIGLNSVLDGILLDYPNLGQVTVFVPLDFGFVGASHPFLDRVMRYHLARQRCNFSELASLPNKARLSTLLKEEQLEVSSGIINGTQAFAINGMNVASPDAFSNEMFVVHVISRHFDFANSAKS